MITERLRIGMVGGDWNNSGGRPSSYVNKFSRSLQRAGAIVHLRNGGMFNVLRLILSGEELDNVHAILWMANVPNNLPKVRGIKERHPHTFLVATKRNNNEYSFQELLNRALGVKANLCIDFRKTEDGTGMIEARLYDPLGVVWCDYTTDVDQLASWTVSRLTQLQYFTRRATIQEPGPSPDVPDEARFFEIVKRYADALHLLLQPAEGVTRFLGNSSFRCARGFPSLRGPGDIVFVSRRNVDKRFISAEMFVATRLIDGDVHYWGRFKPSVDTPIQLRLYEALPHMNCMIHTHAYIEGAPFTPRALPCGALEEVSEVLSCIPDRNTKDPIRVNLKGHGSIAMTHEAWQLVDIPYVARPLPEHLAP